MRTKKSIKMKVNPIQIQTVSKLVLMGAIAASLLLAAHGVMVHGEIATGTAGDG
jgi:hypothetical protein